MSPHAVNNFVSDLVLMAQAMEELPKVRDELAQAHRDISNQANTIASLHNDIDQAKTYASTLEQKVHDLEVAKDQAETMFLEADDRTTRALDFIKATFGNAGSLIQALEPPKLEPPQVAQVVQHMPEGYREIPRPEGGFDVPHYEKIYPEVERASDPTPPVGTTGTTTKSEPIADTKPSPPSWNYGPGDIGAVAEPVPEVAPQPDPTVTATQISPLNSVTDTSQGSVVESTQEQPKPGPYHGRRYIDVKGWISRSDWLAGGGTEEDYDWRESHGVSSF